MLNRIWTAPSSFLTCQPRPRQRRSGFQRLQRACQRGLLGFLPVSVLLAAEGWAAPPPLVTQYLPDNTALAILFDTTPDTWGQLNQYHLFKVLEAQSGYTPALPGVPYLPLELDYATTVAPWIGETAVVALLPSSRPTNASLSHHMLLVAPVADAAAADNYLEQVAATFAEPPKVQTYQGISIWYWPTSTGEEFPRDPDQPVPEFPQGFPQEFPQKFPQKSSVRSDAVEVKVTSPGGWKLAEDAAMVSPQGVLSNPVSLVEPGTQQAERPAPQTLRFARSLPLTLTLQSTAALPQPPVDFDIPIPVPLPEVGEDWGLAIARLPNLLIAAESPAALQKFIDQRPRNGGSSLANYPRFQRTLAHPQKDVALMALYGNLLELLNYSASAFAATDGLPPSPIPLPTLPSDGLTTLRALNWGGSLEALIFPTTAGLQFQGRFYYDDMPFTLAPSASPADADWLLDVLPAPTYVLTSGRDLAAVWETVALALENISDTTRDWLGLMRSTVTLATGLNLDEDIFGWLDREFAVALFPAQPTPLQFLHPDLRVGLGLLLQTTDRPTAEHTLTTLDDLAASFGLAVLPQTVNQTPAVDWNWSLLDEPTANTSLLSYSWATADTVAITSGIGPLSELVNPSPHDPLRQYFAFRNAYQQFPQPNNGYFYLDIGTTLTLGYHLFDLHQNDADFYPFKQVLATVPSLSLTTTNTRDYGEIDVLLGLIERR